MKNKAVFLDRDGVINELVYHQEQEVIDSPFTENQFKLLPGVAEAIKIVQQAGYLAVLVSNQPGIAKGHMTSASFEAIKTKMRQELKTEGARLDGEYYCLHHPESQVEALRLSCACRKPQPGLLLKAAQDLSLDLHNSWMIGDNLSDIQAGRSAGCCTIFLGVKKCELCRMMEQRNIQPDHISPDILEAVAIVMADAKSNEEISDSCVKTKFDFQNISAKVNTL
jgi:D-glycero-D-manno-heptose 1,7-bisphosphate phosphatase